MTVAGVGEPAEGSPSPPAQGGCGPQNANTPNAPPSDPPSPPVAAPSPPAPQTDQEMVDSFPVAKLTKLDELISNPRWVIPVLPGGELELLLEHSIELCKRGVDTQSEPCQRFFRDGLTISFTKIMTDEAVSSWRFDIHKCILKNCERLVELVCTKIQDDWFPLLDLLALIFNPNNKFHVYNSSRACETSSTLASGGSSSEEEMFAAPIDSRLPKGWLVDMINAFGHHNGFKKVHDRIMSGENLTVPLIFALVRPFGMCFELLTLKTVKQYFLPIIEAVPNFLENLTDEELKKEAKNESKNDTISAIVKSLKNLASLVPGQDEKIKSLEMFRLKMLLRQLQISSFSGKMSALNEVNKVISGVIYTPQRHSVTTSQTLDDEDWLTADRMAAWIKDNQVIKIVLRDSLHQPQYVEKLEKMIRFVIKEKSLSLSDLDDIWAAQAGKHEAIVKNVHDLLAKLAWDFSPEQLDHLFECFQASWRGAAAKQREKLLELIRRLAEDDKDGVMADKVLKLFWTLAHSADATTEIMDQALSAHVKILDYSCTQYREQQKNRWLDKCVEELKANDKWVLPALKQIKEICSLYQEQPATGMHGQRAPAVVYRSEVINRLQQSHALVILIADNLTQYMAGIRASGELVAKFDPNEFSPDGRYSHTAQVSERLNFLRFLLRDGQLWLCAPQAKQIWHCLAEEAVFSTDREQCFKWFSKLMGDEPDLDPEINRDFFESNLLKLDPALLTEAGIKCFERFFKAVNCKEGKLIPKRRATLMDDLELVGLDYCWKVVLCSNTEVSNKAIDLLKETFTNLGPRLVAQQVEIHEDFISSCMDRLKASFDTVTVLQGDAGRTGDSSRIQVELQRLCRVLRVLHEYVSECDGDFQEERTFLPLHRAARGKQLSVTVRYPNTGRQVDDMDFWLHDNETLATFRRMVFQKLKASPSNIKLELFLGQEILDIADDRKIIALLPIRDKCIITAKLSQTGAGAGASSPDSSSDSSGGSPQHLLYEGPNVESEQCLPGVIMAHRQNHAVFLCQLAELGCTLGSETLRDGARQLLKLMPADQATLGRVRAAAETASGGGKVGLEQLFLTASHSLTLYQLECCLSLVMPASGQGPLGDKAFEFQVWLVRGGGVPLLLNMLTSPTFLQGADMITKKAAYLAVLRLSKFLLGVVGHSLFYMVVEAQQPTSNTKVSDSTHNHAVMLQQALQAGIPCPGEVSLRQTSSRLGQTLLEAGTRHLPDMATVRAVLKLAWSSSASDLAITATDQLKELHKSRNVIVDQDYARLARESLEVLTLAIALCPTSLDTLSKDKAWHSFLVDLVLLSPDRSIRMAAAEQFLLICTRATSDSTQVKMMVTLLFTVVNTLAKEWAEQSAEYFLLLTRLLSYLSSNGVVLTNSGALLAKEIETLATVRQNVLHTGNTGVCNTTLEGHLNITRELVLFLPSERKLEIGTNCSSKSPVSPREGPGLIRELVEDWIFPASKLWVAYSSSGAIPHNSTTTAVCQTPSVTAAAFDLLVSLCTGCPGNLSQLAAMLTEMFYTRDEVVGEWEYLPPVGPRPSQGFVGLKNAGATCYMNSVLQQLYMLGGIKEGVLKCEDACTDPNEDFSGEEKLEVEPEGEEDDRGDYNLTILKQVQSIFGHLSSTQLQYYVPKGLWRHFRMLGEPVNLREQQDAVEFFMTLIDTIDEAMKSVGHEQVCSKVLGGVISDQKICKTCPHRYSRQEPCSVISVDVKNHSNLMDSLAEYTKGELLETENAYYCERCDKKVDTVKRLCVKKLPPILVIQLKRFDYDFERDAAVKFNDYFEFPRELDMEPYTVAGLARRENEAVDCEPEDLDPSIVRKYRLRGMVVHSGQASGGHYYSYIKDGDKWYKFDDGDVTEVNMQEDEEFKSQCWGGEYMSEVFDHMLKRMSYRRQKRWWNAYMLFYCRADLEPGLDESGLARDMEGLSVGGHHADKEGVHVVQPAMPKPIERSILKQNVKFLHNRNQFSAEYFSFMRKLIQCNAPYVTVGQGEKLSQDQEELAMTTVQLASAFLFTVGFHTKKSLRGNATDWYEILSQHLRCSPATRSWFSTNVLFSQPSRFSEYLLECPSAEVRQAVSKLIVFCAHFASSDPPCPTPSCLSNIPVDVSPNSGLSDHLLLAVLALLWVEVSEHGRHLSQYFNLFAIYASLGVPEKTQLLKLNVASLLMSVALDDGPGPPIKYQYAELGKLYQVVSTLVRCCDVSAVSQSSVEGQPPLPNPYMDPALNHNYIMPIQPTVSDLLFNRYGYLKKLIEEANQGEDTRRLLQFCCWENPQFSHAVLYELLWQIAFAYTYELRPYLDLLLHMLCMEDSWQTHRIHKALKGIPDDHSSRDGLFETIQRSKNHYQKRAYQCIKMLVALFSQCPQARTMLDSAGDLKRKWTWSVEWLHDELERGGGHRAPYASTAGSNETANGYFLERSHSARLTLEKACELMPDEDGDEGVGGAEGVAGVPVGDLDERKEGRTLARQGGSAGSITHGVPVQREGGGAAVSPTQQNKQRMRRRRDAITDPE